MDLIKASISQADIIFDIVQETIKTVYPKYYPKEVVDFFCQLHGMDNIKKDIQSNCVNILIENGEVIGTGSYNDNHITRVYILPRFQKRGYGSYIMKSLENEIVQNYDKVYLDASLPASKMYENRGYKTISHEIYEVENGVNLVYEVMSKKLTSSNTNIFYDGKKFIPKYNTENGEVDGQTIFLYHQNKNILWAEYSGGEVINGTLMGTVAENGELDFYYQHINNENQVRVGKCHSTPVVLENGKIELLEKWQWLNGDQSEGQSVLVEK